uniref:Cadherin domain-containing protein n=1 Tax=Xiphophorus couchianus TaxID=32473 RepID=A0A3B5KVF5_9TELE
MELKIIIENPLEIHYVVVEIKDVNDHSPVFPEKEQRFEIGEQTLPGRRFQLHAARDPDSGSNSIRTYILTSNEHFEIDIRVSDDDKIPFLVLKKSLDREQKSRHLLHLTGIDGGKPPRSGTLNISIIVLDSNDNRPKFSVETYEVEIQENIPVENNVPGTVIFGVSASDKDLSDNAAIAYRTARDGQQNSVISFLSINSENGEISALKSFDFETLKTFQFQVVATDSGTPSLSSNVTVNVFILDQNDNAPVILYPLSSNGSAEGVEEIPRNVNAGHLVTKVRAYDADIGYNAHGALFEVNPNNGMLYVRQNIDREQLCDRNIACLTDLKIVVENPLEVHYVSVEIIDANDHAPAFAEKEKVIEIAEQTATGTRFQLPGAHDPDVGINSIQRYKLSQNDNFHLEIRDRGEDKIPFLVLQRQLDREQKTKHSLVLTAMDGGAPSQSAQLNVTVKVLDTNDNRPIFSKEVYSAVLQENAVIDTVVIKVEATDLDEGPNADIEYAFGTDINSDLLKLFSLNTNTGEIRVSGLIDYETANVYKLDVQASDKGQPPMTTDCRVIIKIQDVNDNKPEIDITSLSILYRLTDNVPFELKPSYKENMYSLPSLSTVKTLIIQVSDVNDNTPVFLQNPLELYLMENNAPGETIFSVSALDKDLNENAVLSYRLLKSEGGHREITSFLNIHADTGQISAMKSFDFETLKTFQFQVVATDSGTPSLSSNVTVNVFILDQNDNAPVILYPLSSNGSAEGVEEIPRNLFMDFSSPSNPASYLLRDVNIDLL